MNLYEGIDYLLTEKLLAHSFLTTAMFTLGERDIFMWALGYIDHSCMIFFFLIHQKVVSGNKPRIIDGLQEKC